MFLVASLLEGLVCSQQLTFFPISFPFVCGASARIARWGRGRQLDALLKIFINFSPTSWPVFSPTFSAPFSTSFSAAFVASFFAVLPVNFAAIFPNTSPNPSPTRSRRPQPPKEQFPLCQDLFLFFQFPFLVLYNNCQGNVYVIQIYFAIFVISKPKSDFRDCFCVNFTPQIIIGLNSKGHRSCLCRG